MTREERRLERERKYQEERRIYDENALQCSLNFIKNKGLIIGGEEITEYEIAVTFDRLTCPECAKWDGKVLSLNTAEIGVNCPPFHSGCRCMMIQPSKNRMYIGTKIARNKDDKNIYVPADMIYSDYKKLVLDEDANPQFKKDEYGHDVLII